MDKLNIQGRKPKTKKRIDDRIENVKNPYYVNNYIWKLDTHYIRIRANIENDKIQEDTWSVDIFEKYEHIEQDNSKMTFTEDTLDDAIESAERYAERCNLTVEEYVVPS